MPLAGPRRHHREPERGIGRLDVAIEGRFGRRPRSRAGGGLAVNGAARGPRPAQAFRGRPERQGGCDEASTERREGSGTHKFGTPTNGRDHTADAGAKTNLSRSIFQTADLVWPDGWADRWTGGPLPCSAGFQSMHDPRPTRLGRVLSCVSGLAAILVLSAAPATAQVVAAAAAGTDLKPLTQYHLESWQTRDGLPTNGLRALAQDAEGFLWLGTEAGLVRFDGVEFRTFDRNSTPSLKANDVTALFVDKANRLWIGTDDGAVLRRRDGAFEEFSQVRLSGMITAFYQDQGGTIWVAGGDSVGRVSENTLVLMPKAREIVSSIYEDGTGGLALGTSGPLLRVENDSIRIDENGPEDVQAALRAADGTLWQGLRNGLRRSGGSRPDRLFTVADGLPSLNVTALAFDRRGGLWIGTTSGVSRLVGDRLVSRTATRDADPEGMVVTDLLEDREGSIWVATRHAGLHQLRDVPFQAITKRQGLAHDDVLAVFEDHAANLWVGTDGAGLTRLDGNKSFTWTMQEGLPSNIIWTIAETRDGAIWVGTAQRAGPHLRRTRHQLPERRRLPARRCPRHPRGPPRQPVDRQQSRWSVAAPRQRDAPFHQGRGQLAVLEQHHGAPRSARRGPLDRHDGRRPEPAVARPLQLLLDRAGPAQQRRHRHPLRGSARVGRHGRRQPAPGAQRSRCSHLPTRGGASSGHALQILDDDRGSIWMSGERGITRLERSELLKVANSNVDAATARVYDFRDGFGRWEFQGVSQSSGVRRADGSLAFPSATGVIIVRSEAFAKSTVAPFVKVLEVLADGRSIPIDNDLVLPAGVEQLEVRYTATSLAVPSRVQFRYRLEGADASLVDAGPRRVAFYSNLRGGRYRFHVKATNSDGVLSSRTRVAVLARRAAVLGDVVVLRPGRRRLPGQRPAAVALPRPPRPGPRAGLARGRGGAHRGAVAGDHRAPPHRGVAARVAGRARGSRGRADHRAARRARPDAEGHGRAPPSGRAAGAGAEAREHRPARRRRRARHQQRAHRRPELLGSASTPASARRIRCRRSCARSARRPSAPRT